jgi:hypothetical protein
MACTFHEAAVIVLKKIGIRKKNAHGMRAIYVQVNAGQWYAGTS